ncbi:MAG: secretin N-terminal domain-containing protein [SAR324 cluster bacterium]|nr:secretin N-terminal domain-containing protein [SAR324 cluster bacterium]
MTGFILLSLLLFNIYQPFKLQAAKNSSGSKVSINLPQTIILKEFIKIISKNTGTVFVYEEKNMRGQMSITAPRNFKVTPEDAFFFFEKILASQGLAMVRRKESNVVEILPTADARFSRLPITNDGEKISAKSGNYVMRLIPIFHASLKGIQSTLQPIFSKTGVLLVYEPMNMLIVIDVESNVSRIVELIDMLDTSAPEGVEQVVTLQQIIHNDVSEIHKTVSELFSNLVRNGKPTKFKLLIETRLNSLFIVANRDTTEEIIELIEKVDVPVEGAKTTIHELNYSDAAKLVPLITTVFPKTNSIKIVPFAPFNALIIIANPVTTRQIIDLVDQLDIPRGNRQIMLQQLNYASAKTLAPLLSKIFSDKVIAGKGEGKTSSGSPVKIIAEPRLNALIIIADRLATDRVLQLISKLDTEQGTSGETQLKLIPLKNTSAKRMANLLTKIFADKVVAGKGEGNTAKTSPVKIIEEERLNSLIIIAGRIEIDSILSLIKQLDVYQESGKIQSNFKLYHLQHAVAKDMALMLKEVTGKITEVARKDEKPLAGTKAQSKTTKSGTQSEISISADEATNSLLIFAPADAFKTLDQIIVELDVARMQVYVEALVMEVTLSKSLDLGINWKAAGTTNKNRIITGGFPNGGAFTGPNSSGSLGSATSASADSTIGVLNGNTISIGGQEFFSFGAFVKAVQNNNDVNVLANPQLMIINNPQEGEVPNINVVSVVPVSPKTVTSASNITTKEYQYKEVGIKLEIKPQISGENSIRLDIAQESSDVVNPGAEAITIFKRTIKTSVIAEDGEIIVLGGLIKEKIARDQDKIPGFGDLPLLGWLFRSKKDQFEKINLLIFIRPNIIRTKADLERVNQNASSRFKKVKELNKVTNQVLEDMGLPELSDKAERVTE